ncbi:hypothetical protein [Mycobacteroides abscessus]|uniref:hypothetical protein n=1 Tax=Mycobacteroides abscessus TaxID=36809 RepID=UPI0012FFF56D|nr:hypothetical protein [Mycobacteroides abscessus]
MPAQAPNYSGNNSLPPLNQNGSVDINNPAPAQQAPAQAPQNAPAQNTGQQPAHGQQPSTFDNPPGQIQQNSPQKPEQPTRSLPPCNGTWAGEAIANVEQTPQGGIRWAVKLLPMDAKYGIVDFETEVIINNSMVVNGYQPHIEPWNYLFHGSIPKIVQVSGSPAGYTLKSGDVLHFIWMWTSVADGQSGAMTELQCVYG